MIDDGFTETQRAFLASQSHRKAFEDMSAIDINRMDMATYARLTGREAPAQAALQAADAEPTCTSRQAPAPAQEPVQDPVSEPQGPDPDSAEFFHAWRASRTRGGEGVGIFDSVGSRSDEFTAAGRTQFGRTGWSQSNLQEAPRVGRAYVPEEQPPVYASAQARFTTPGNAFGS